MNVVDTLRELFQTHQSIKLAILFGSVAKGTARPDSDIDLAIDLGCPMSLEEKMELIADIAMLTGRPVDLIDLSSVGEPLLG